MKKTTITTITAMPDATMTEDESGVTLKLHGVGKPDNKHDWLDIEGFRDRGKGSFYPQGQGMEYGTVVVTSIQVGTTDSLKYVGYVVQIRRQAGFFGSDDFYIRHPDGSLIRHSNQSFYILCPEDAKIVLEHSKYQPEDEGGDQGYTADANESTRRSGFIIEV